MKKPLLDTVKVLAGSVAGAIAAIVLALQAVNNFTDEAQDLFRADAQEIAGEALTTAQEARDTGPRAPTPEELQIAALESKIDSIQIQILNLKETPVTRLSPKQEFHFLLLDALDSLGLARNLLRKEVLFHKTRQWRFDYAIPALHVAFEYEGRGQGHLSWTEYSKDCEKYTWANALGWAVVRITPGMIQDGRAGRLIRDAINFAINPELAKPYKRPIQIPLEDSENSP